MMNAAEKRKDRILEGLAGARKCILEAAGTISAEKADEPFLGVWSVLDLLAHLVGWDHTNIAATSEIRAGHIPAFYSQWDRDWRTYNAQLVQQYRVDDLTQMVSLTEQSHRQLIEFLRSVPPEEFDKDRGIRVNRYKVTIGRLLDVEVKDEWEHCEQIRRVATGARAGQGHADSDEQEP